MEYAALSEKKALPKSSSLLKLDPVLNKGLIRIGGSLKNSLRKSFSHHQRQTFHSCIKWPTVSIHFDSSNAAYLEGSSPTTGIFFSISEDKFRPLPMSSGSDEKRSTYQPYRVVESGMRHATTCKKLTLSYLRITKLLAILGLRQCSLLLFIAKMEKYRK